MTAEERARLRLPDHTQLPDHDDGSFRADREANRADRESERADREATRAGRLAA